MSVMWPLVAAMFLIEIIYRALALAKWPTPLSKRLRLGHAVVLALAVTIILCHWVIYLLSLLK
jgi:hypothetical protein